MSQYPNSGVLFKNNRKNQDKHPDYTGNGEYDGKPIEIAAWIRDGRKGKFLSLKFKPAEADFQRQPAPSDGQAPSQPEGAAPQPEDDVPF